MRITVSILRPGFTPANSTLRMPYRQCRICCWSPPVTAAPPTCLGPRPRRRPRLLRHHRDPIFGRSLRQRRNRGSLATKRSSLRPGARMILDLYRKRGPTSSAAAIRLSRTGRSGTPPCLRRGRIVSSDGAVPTCLPGMPREARIFKSRSQWQKWLTSG